MAELTAVQEQAVVPIEDPILEQYTQSLFNEFIRSVPGLNPEQQQAAMQFFQGVAAEKLQHEREILRLEGEKENLQEKSDRDPYNPEIYSAAGWYRIMKTKLAELRRNGQSAVIVALDLDNFKQYNDINKSHKEGDNALGLAGGLVKSVIRPTDIVARLHGDEFVTLLVTDLKGGIIVAKRIGEVITDMSNLLKTPIRFSASIGIVQLDPDIIKTEYQSDEQLVELLKQSYALADRAQYEGAKNIGKNRIGVMLPDGTIKTAVVQPAVQGQPAIVTYHSINTEAPQLAAIP